MRAQVWPKVADTACLPQLMTSTLRKAYKKLSTLKSLATHSTSAVSRLKNQSWELCVPNYGQVARMVISLHKGLVGTQSGKLPTTDWMKWQAGTADCFGGRWEGRKSWSFEIDPLTSSDGSPCREVCFCCQKCTLAILLINLTKVFIVTKSNLWFPKSHSGVRTNGLLRGKVIS